MSVAFGGDQPPPESVKLVAHAEKTRDFISQKFDLIIDTDRYSYCYIDTDQCRYVRAKQRSFDRIAFYKEKTP